MTWSELTTELLSAASENTNAAEPRISPSQELVFVDESVANFEQMIADLHLKSASDPNRDFEIVILNSRTDGRRVIGCDSDGSEGDDSGNDIGSTDDTVSHVDSDTSNSNSPDPASPTDSAQPSGRTAPHGQADAHDDENNSSTSTSVSVFFADIFPGGVPESHWALILNPFGVRYSDEDPFVETVVTTVFGNTFPVAPLFTDVFLSFSDVESDTQQSGVMADLDLHEQLVVGSSVAVSTSFSVGYVVWMLRGGSLMTALMSSLPA